ncbi:sugar 3,4-ketoisomerase [Paenibacillus elgii]|uniref:sugar 3,4-ketoisomerase n=1 Tax=Paenibacillus elgii TaxID=189691 RepID=UPI000FD6F1C7|nr:FdtA/QdtA family cupin domain-containing protein [Paenibacillus elgii]NEN84303.1 WxcM-like domain-containing protein [Paenibacillus elgii]
MNLLSKVIKIKEFEDNRGKLAVLEASTDIPFEIKRIFYIYNTPSNVVRGGHAHFKTRQALIALSGYCTISLDNLKRKTEIELTNPSDILILEPNDWHEMYKFSSDCVLLVMASHYYDAEDYIHSYNKFVEVYE